MSLLFCITMFVAPMVEAAEPLKEGAALPPFVLPDAEGRSFSSASLAGKPALLNFWASWCTPCRIELPLLQALSERLAPTGIVVLTINVDVEQSAPRAMISRLKLKLPVLFDPQNQVVAGVAPLRLPVTYLLDAKGIVRRIYDHALRDTDLVGVEEELRGMVR